MCSARGIARFGSICNVRQHNNSSRQYTVAKLAYDPVVAVTHNLAIQDVLLGHDGIDRGRILEGQERESSRPSRRVPHNGRRCHPAKLGKVAL